jgi:hypothetical protein
MPAFEPGWEAVLCRCRCLRRRTRFPLAVDPPCLFVLTAASPPSWPAAMASASACSRTCMPLNSRTRAPAVHPRMRTRSPRGKEPRLPFVSLNRAELTGFPPRRAEAPPSVVSFPRWCERHVIPEPARTFSCVHDPLPAPAAPAAPPGLAPPRKGARCHHPASAARARGHRPCTRHAPEFFLVHMLAHVLTRASGCRGKPSLVVADSMFAAAPAMVSTPPHRLSPLQAASFSALGEPVEPPDSRHGACCPGAARPHRRRGRPAPPPPLGHFVEHLAVVTKPRRVSLVHVGPHTLLAAADPPDPVRLPNHLPKNTAAYTAPQRPLLGSRADWPR